MRRSTSSAFLPTAVRPMADHYTVVSCGECGFVFADTTVDQKKFDSFYADLSKYQDTTPVRGRGNRLGPNPAPGHGDRLIELRPGSAHQVFSTSRWILPVATVSRSGSPGGWSKFTRSNSVT